MSYTDYNYGDKVRLTMTDDLGSRSVEGWIVPEEAKPGGQRLWCNFVDPEPELAGMTFVFDGILSDPDVEVELVATAGDQVPTEPGRYIDQGFEAVNKLHAAVTGIKYTPQIWTVDEHGSLFDPTGERAEDLYVVTAMGVQLVPAEG